MSLASRTGLFAYFCIFQLKNLETNEMKQRKRKTNEEILKKMKDLMIEEIVHKIL